MRILYLKTDVFADEAIRNKGFAMITEERKAKIRIYKNEMTARLSLGAGVLLRIAMDRKGVSEKEILYEEYGKPYFFREDFHFNLSHSGEYVFCVYDNMPIGIDLQKVKVKMPDHTGKILSEDEKKYLASLNEMERVSAFYRIWAGKESIIKWDGRGLRLPLQNISVTDRDRILSQIYFEEQKLFLTQLDLLQPVYAISICSQQNTKIEEIENIDSNFLTKY